ncbi:MAG TPA: helix-turn-helix domain-containing protein [Thermomonas sp.]|nr:helix-turn-helix domain-containing protein [Thermomonas sp.]
MSNYVSGLVWRHFPGVGSELLAMLAMADWCNDDGRNLFPSIATVAKRIRTSESQARRVLRKLETGGWLEVIGNKFGGAPGSTRRYRLSVARLGDSSTARMDATPQKETAGTDARDGLHGCEKTGGTDASQDVKEHPSISINQKKRSRASQQEISADDLIAEGVDSQHAQDWLKVRSRKRAPLTVTAWNDTKAEARKAGITAAEAVRIAASLSWQGFRASWLNNLDGERKHAPRESVTDATARVNREHDLREGGHAPAR